MNKLQKAAGLLNDEAPKGEFLAYINAKEAGLLSSQGGAGIDINNSGVPSYVDFGGGGSGYGSAQDSFDAASGNPGASGGGSRSDNDSGSDTVVGSDIDMQYTVGDGYGEGNYVSTVGDWAESRGLTEDYSSEDLESQVVLDQAAFDAGFRSQDFKDYYSGESINIQNLNTPEINLVRQLVPQAPGLMSGEELPTSVFETFFGKSIGIMGNDIMDRYETAKQNVATTIASPQTSFASYGIFQDARNRGII